MMYLSQLILNLRSREARQDLADRFELHRTILNAFPETLPDDERVLYRVEEGALEPMVVILVQSQYQPKWTDIPRLRQAYLEQQPRVREIHIHTETGKQHRFRLQANPTIKRDGKRHALYADDALHNWLVRKGEQHGFYAERHHVQMVKLGKKHGKKRQQTWHVVQFDGLLKVTDEPLFINALREGVGSGKAFGFGLLSIPYTAS